MNIKQLPERIAFAILTLATLAGVADLIKIYLEVAA